MTENGDTMSDEEVQEMLDEVNKKLSVRTHHVTLSALKFRISEFLYQTRF